MLVSCERCSTTYVLEDALVPEDGVPVQCTRCSNIFRAHRPLGPRLPARLQPEVVPFRAAGARHDVMLFGSPDRVLPRPAQLNQRMVFGLPDPTQPPAEIYRSAEGRVVFGLPDPAQRPAEIGPHPAAEIDRSAEGRHVFRTPPASPEPHPPEPYQVLASCETDAPFALHDEATAQPEQVVFRAEATGDFASAAPPVVPTFSEPVLRARPRVKPDDDVLATAAEPHRLELLPAGELAWPRIATHVPGSEEALRSLGHLPAPFISVHAVDGDGRSARVVSDRFVGVTLARAAQVLRAARRQFPLEVWLRLADRWLAFLGELSPQHLLWMTWMGPHSLGVDVTGRLVLFATRAGSPVPAWSSRPQEGGLHSEWLDLRPGAQASASAPLAAVCKALIWLLDPHPFERLDALALRPPRPARPWDGRWSHPQVPQALADVLNGWLERPPVHDGTIAGLRAELLRTAGVPPASDERVTSVFVSAAQLEFAALADGLAHETTTLPSAWRGGGLSVVVDQLLERAAPLGECPLEIGASAGPERAAFIVVPTGELQIVVTDAKGVVVHRMAIGAGAPRSKVALPLATRCPKDSRFTVTVKHPAIPDASVALQALSDPRGWVELQVTPGPVAEALEHLWSSLREAGDDEGFQVPRLAPAPARTPPPRQSRYEHYVDTGGLTLSEWTASALEGCLYTGCLGGLVALPMSALCWFDVLPWSSLWWLFGVAVVLAMLLGFIRRSEPSGAE